MGATSAPAGAQVVSSQRSAPLGTPDFAASTRLQYGASVPPDYQVAIVGNQGLAPGASAQISSPLLAVVQGQGGQGAGTSPSVWNTLTGTASFRVQFVAAGPPGQGLIVVTVNGPGFAAPVVLSDAVDFSNAQGVNLNFLGGGGAFYGGMVLTSGAGPGIPIGPSGNWSGTVLGDSTLSGWNFAQNWSLQGSVRFFPGGGSDVPRLQLDVLNQGLAYQLSGQGAANPFVVNYGYVQDLSITAADFQQARFGGTDGLVEADIFSRSSVTFDIAAGSPVEFAGGLLDLTNAVTFVDPSDYGTASFVKDGAGTLILSGSSSYSGTMRLNDGTVVLRDASGIGAGGLEIGTATLRLETDVNFGATLPIDVLAASDAVIEGDGRRPVGLSSTITGDALSTLTLRDLDVDFDGDAAGFLGELIVDDSGFTMDQETVGGSMTARNDSLLDATGQIAGDLTVQSSTLQLTGGVPAGPGTLDVLGNLSLDAGSVLRANVFLPLVGGAGTIRESDRINVLTGGSTAAMGGTLVALLNRDVSPGEVIPLRNQERSWRIIDAAGGGTGQFSAARLIVFDASSGIISDVDLPINSTLSTDIVEYRTTFDASGALITLFGLPTVPPDVVVDTACGTYTGTQINELIDLLLRTEALGNDDASAVAGAMLLYENVADIPPAYAATQQRSPYADPDVVIDSNVMAGRLAMLRLMQLRDGALGAAAANAADTRPGGGARPAPAQARDFRAPLNGPTPDDGERVWLRGYGFYETVDGDPCFGCGFDASIGAAMAGADWEIDGGGIIGGFVGGGAGSIQQDAIYGDQHTGITQGFAGIYGSLVPGKGDVYLQGFALGGYASLDRTRTIAIPDMVVTRNAESTNGAWTVSAGGEVGLNLELSRRTWLQPFAGVSWAQYWGGGYAETGAQSLDLTVQQQSAGELQPTAGARFMFASRSGRDVLSPFVGAAFLAQLPMGDGWAPVYTSDFNLGESMQFAGDPEDRYGGNIQVGLEFARFDGMTAFIAFDGAWLTGKQRYGGQIGVFVPF